MDNKRKEKQARCIKRIERTMPFCEGAPFDSVLTCEVGEYVSLTPCSDSENYKIWSLKFMDNLEMTPSEIIEYFEIVYEPGCYNGCIINDVPCVHLRGYQSGDTARDPRREWTCRIHWEIGRASCAEYYPESLKV